MALLGTTERTLAKSRHASIVVHVLAPDALHTVCGAIVENVYSRHILLDEERWCLRCVPRQAISDRRQVLKHYCRASDRPPLR
jgi:hypothetical protein